MLDWETQLVQWRRDLASKVGPDASVLAELEEHLREEIERLIQLGQAPDEAVRTAIAKLGTPEKLAPEFAKNAVAWWPIRCVVAGTGLVVVFSLYFCIQMAQRTPLDSLLVAHVSLVTVGYLLTCSIGVLALCYALRRMVRELCPGQQTSWIRALWRLSVVALTLTFFGTVLGGIWANRQWGSYWNWDLKETGALATVIWQSILLLSLWRLADKMRWLVCWAVLGDVIITFAWFVARDLGSRGQVHAYGQESYLTVIVFLGVLITHLLVIAGALAPSGWLRLRKLAE